MFQHENVVALIEEEEEEEEEVLITPSYDDRQPKLYRRRWFVLICYCVLTLSCNSGYFIFASVSSITRRHYHISLGQVNTLTILYESMSILLSLPFGYMADKRGLTSVLVTSSLLNALGSICRLLGAGENGYWLLIVGTLIRSSAMAGFMLLPPRLASVWFGAKERGLATGIAVAMDGVGMAAGLVQGPAMIHNHKEADQLAGDFQRVFITQSVFAFLVFLYILLVARDKPRTAPSPSQALVRILDSSPQKNGIDQVREGNRSADSDQPLVEDVKGDVLVSDNQKEFTRLSFVKETRILLRCRQFILILALHAIVYVFETIILTFLNELLIPFYPGQDFRIGLMGAVAVMGSMAGNIALGPLIDRTRHLLWWAWGIFMTSALSTLAFTLLYLFHNSFAPLFVTLLFAETICASFFTLAFELSAEATFPIPESTSATLLLVTGQGSGVIVSSITSQLFARFGAISVLIVWCSLCFLSVVFLIPLKEPSVRSDIDDVSSQNDSS